MADPVHPIDADADADDELATFREQWRQEVETRKRQHQEAAAQVKKPQQAATSSVRNVNVEQSDEQLPRERLRPRGILDAERTEEQKITSGILQDEVELARAIGSIQLGGGETHVSGKPTIHEHRSVKAHGKPSSAPAGGKPLSPKPRHAQPATFAKSTHTKDHTPTLYTTRKAVEAYSQAVDLESSGQLNEALHLYRKAYKLDDRVDKAYNSAVVKAEEKDRAEVVEKEVVDPTLRVVATPPPMEPYVFKTHTQLEGDYHSPVPTVRPASASASTAAATITKSADTQHAEWSDPLTRIINTFSEAETLYTLDFMPEEEKWPCLFGRLPDEVVENIVFFLDVQSLERFAASCKKARLVTRVAPVWRYLCEKIYRPPLLPLEIKPVDLAARHGFDWRSTFLEERRVRYDGLYISVCHYIRPGQSDMAWVNPTHLITYHRFLRFYPDGRVISYLTTDHPVDVVHTVRPSLRAKGTLFGQWGISTMKDSKGREIPRIELRSLLEPGVTPKYEFEMDLCLKTTQRGRWNKLDMLTYQSINLVNGEALGLSLKHQKPFYFSKVRSYREQL